MDALEKEYFDEMKDNIDTMNEKIDLLLSHFKIEYNSDYDDEDESEDEDDENANETLLP